MNKKAEIPIISGTIIKKKTGRKNCLSLIVGILAIVQVEVVLWISSFLLTVKSLFERHGALFFNPSSIVAFY